jgi:O-antigen/teichoic acid export membrane protein
VSGGSVLATGAARRRAVLGVRAALILNVLALPLSFVTNMILGRISPEALGAYGAIQLFVGSSFTFLVFGGANVFTRFVPAIEPPARLAFFRAYGAVVAIVFAVVVAATLAVPGAAEAVLRPLGAPPPAIPIALLAASAVAAMTGWYLYADEESTSAVAVEKLIVLGFFVTALVALTSAGDALRRGDTSFLWRGALVVYVVAAAVALIRLTSTSGFAMRRRGWLLPEGFWSVATYTHVDTLVTYVYVALAPSVIVLWVDLRTLGFLHAALRYTVLLAGFPVAVMAVLGPELRRLVAAGDRDEASRQASFSVQVAMLVLGPIVLGLIAFAEPAMAVFGPGFSAQADVLRLVAPSVLSTPVFYCGASFAVAVGVFRAYLRASILYVVIAMALLAVLVPAWGVRGAAAAMTLGAIVRMVATAAILRREGFRTPARVAVAWGCSAVGLAVMLAFHPPWPAAAGLAVVLLVAFGLLGRVRLDEFRRLARWGLGRI